MSNHEAFLSTTAMIITMLPFRLGSNPLLPRFPPRGDGSESREDLVHLEARGVWRQAAHEKPQVWLALGGAVG